MIFNRNLEPVHFYFKSINVQFFDRLGLSSKCVYKYNRVVFVLKAFQIIHVGTYNYIIKITI